MKISLLIPAYNATPFLADLIEDARQQNPPFTEILLYDDASTDGTAELAKSLDIDTIIQGTENKGASYARNRLIDACATEWLHFHDADDRLAPAYTAIMTSSIPRDNEVIFCAYQYWDALTDTFSPAADIMVLDGCNDLNRVLYSQFQLGCALYPTAWLRSINGFREDLRGAEDHDIHVRLFLKGARFRAVPEVLNTYRRFGNTSFTETQLERFFSDWHRLLQSYVEILPKECHDTLGLLIMENAYKLYHNGQMELARESVALARSINRHGVASSNPWLRRLSRITGPWPIFRARTLLNQIREPSNNT